MKNNRIEYLDILRLLACFFVVFNHTKTNGFFLFSLRNIGSIEYYLYMFISIFCKCAVPIFFAISGILLLEKKEETLKDILKKRVFKILLLLISFSFLYYCYDVYIGNQVFSFKKFFIQIFEQNWNFTFWYLYAYIGFLITLPILRPIAQNLSKRQYEYLILLVVIINGILPVSQYLLWEGNHYLSRHFDISWITSNIFIYPLVGYYVHYKSDIYKDKKKVYILAIINVLCIVLSVVATNHNINVTGICNEASTQQFHSSFSIINCITIMTIVKYLFNKYNLQKCSRLNKLIEKFAATTLGIYLLHIFLLYDNPYVSNILNWFLSLGINSMISVFIYCFIIMVLGAILTTIIKQIGKSL